MFQCSKFPGLQKSFDVLQFWADPGSCSSSAYVMISSTVTINAVNGVSGGKKLLLASLQQTCNEYLYLNINKSKLAFLLQKSSGDFWVIWLMFSIFSMFSMLTMFSKLIPYSSIRDGRIQQFLQPCKFQCTNVQMLRFSYVQMIKCSNVQMFKCLNI